MYIKNLNNKKDSVVSRRSISSSTSRLVVLLALRRLVALRLSFSLVSRSSRRDISARYYVMSPHYIIAFQGANVLSQYFQGVMTCFFEKKAHDTPANHGPEYTLEFANTDFENRPS